MTGKLIKYEFKSSMKLMCVIWAALILVSALASFMLHFVNGRMIFMENSALNTIIGILEVVTGFAYFAVFVALVVATLVIIVMRFYKGLLGDEGYLMHTLPVKPWQLITGKGVVAVCIVTASTLVAMLSILILAGSNGLAAIPEMFRGIGMIWDTDPKYILFIFEGLLIIVLYLLKSIYQIYAALSIGQLAGKHRILLSLAAYIGISIIITAVFSILFILTDEIGLMSWLGSFMLVTSDDIFHFGQMTMLILFLGGAVQLAAFHVVSERILSKSLNLQ